MGVNDKGNNVLVVAITANFPSDTTSLLYKKQFTDAYKNLYNCSLKSNSWNVLQIIYFHFYSIYTIDDGQKQHYYANGIFALDLYRKEVEYLSSDKYFFSDMINDINNGTIPFEDISNQQAIFEKTNPVGDVPLALKRYLKSMEQLKSSSGLGV